MNEPQKPEGVHIGEMMGVHAISAAIITIFFRWQGSLDSYWEDGDESLLANGLGAMFDIFYWLVKPRILKWRDG